MKDKNALTTDMKSKVQQLRIEIDTLTENSQRDVRHKYHRLKDEVNELDKTVDKVREIADDSWKNVMEDVTQMWQKIKEEIEVENLNGRKK